MQCQSKNVILSCQDAGNIENMEKIAFFIAKMVYFLQDLCYTISALQKFCKI